jgi:hypothetical protein
MRARHDRLQSDNRETTMTSTQVIDTFLDAIEHATIADCDAWSADAKLDATVPN